MTGVRHLGTGVLPSRGRDVTKFGGETARGLRILIVAFSARYALAQLLDEMFNALSRRIDCRVLVPTNYSGGSRSDA